MRRSAFFWLTIAFNDIILKMKGISLNDIGGENMPKKQLDTLTEPMYYTLIALMTPKCGIEITEFVRDLTQGRVRLVPGTLYAILSKFESEELIDEVMLEGRKRIYQITEKGKVMLMEEHQRLETMLKEGEIGLKLQKGDSL